MSEQPKLKEFTTLPGMIGETEESKWILQRLLPVPEWSTGIHFGYLSFHPFPFKTTNCYFECFYCSSYQIKSQVLGHLVLHKSKTLWSGECPALNTDIIIKQVRIKDAELLVLLKNY